MEYILLGVLFILLSVVYDGSGGGGVLREFWYWTECVFLILLWGLRFQVGGDSLTYEELFAEDPSLKQLFNINVFELRYQPLWYFSEALVKECIDSYYAFQFLHAVVVNICMFRFIKLNFEYRFIATFFYYVFCSYMLCTEVMREALAVCAFTFAWPHIEQKNWLRYYVWCFVGYLFHTSIAFLFFLPPLVTILGKTWTVKRFLVAFLLLLAIMAISTPIVSALFNTGILGDSRDVGAMNYYNKAQSHLDNTRGIGGSNIGVRFVLSILAYYILMVVLRRVRLNSFSNNIIVNLSFSLFILSRAFGIITDRFGNYFDMMFYAVMSQALLITLLQSRRYARTKYLAMIVVLFFSVTFGYYLTRDDSQGMMSKNNQIYYRYYPYHSVLHPVIEPDRIMLRYYNMDYRFRN